MKADDFDEFENDEFGEEDELEAGYFIYRTLLEQGFNERDALNKSGLTKDQLEEYLMSKLDEDDLDGEEDMGFSKKAGSTLGEDDFDWDDDGDMDDMDDDADEDFDDDDIADDSFEDDKW